ncbi:hypothetical protein M413DRAFT_449461 [Hebeloma cylindrosporum]|uniref:Uncharacterized protein n=1 Tax=Hebeloma cylindrosporum TaxID=76867 RepID=A0A0C2Y4N2_HEBCY|nr:hypothetical protein M413DRAFT_449461 [Hebeloma cylindrosporum h7]
MDYKGSDLTIGELLFALHAKVIDLSEMKEPEFQQYELEQYMEKLGDISQSLKRCFNRAAVVNRLPLELLTRVFEAMQSERPSKKSSRVPLTTTRQTRRFPG